MSATNPHQGTQAPPTSPSDEIGTSTHGVAAACRALEALVESLDPNRRSSPIWEQEDHGIAVRTHDSPHIVFAYNKSPKAITRYEAIELIAQWFHAGIVTLSPATRMRLGLLRALAEALDHPNSYPVGGEERKPAPGWSRDGVDLGRDGYRALSQVQLSDSRGC